MIEEGFTAINLKPSTKATLKELLRENETMDELVKRLISYAKKLEA